MRLSKQLCFLVATVIASIVHGAPIGETLERRQAIELQLTPAQKVEVDGSQEVPKILISHNDLESNVQPNCVGDGCQSFTIDMPLTSQMQHSIMPVTTYDPYAQIYAHLPISPPSHAQETPSLPVSPNPLPDVSWSAPLIPVGSWGGTGTPAMIATTIQAKSPKDLAADAALATARKQAESQSTSMSRRSLPAKRGTSPSPKGVTTREISSSATSRRNTAAKRLLRRQLLIEAVPTEFPTPNAIDRLEVLIPVTESKSAELQDGAAHLVRLPSEDAFDDAKPTYGVLPVEKSSPSLGQIFEDAMAEMEASTMLAEKAQLEESAPLSAFWKAMESPSSIKRRSLSEDGSDEHSNWLRNMLRKRLKHDSNGFNASMVGNGAGKFKYGHKIHDNTNAASAFSSSLGVYTTVALSAVLALWAALL